MDLGNICTNSNILQFFLILKYAINIICIIIPIIVMVNAFSQLFKVIISGEKLNEKIAPIVKSTIAGLIVFLLPSIFTFIFTDVIDLSSSDIGLCFTNATLDNIDKYRELEKQKLLEEQEKRSQDNIDAMKDREKEDEERNNNLEQNTRPNNNDNNNSSNNSTTNGGVGYGSLFVGDSRTVGLSYQVNLRDTDHIYATSGGAMDAFKSDINKALSQINSDPNHRYNLVLNYGVNNVSQDWVSAYRDVINKVNGRANILVVSINPCNDGIAKYCRNANIVPLNNKLRAAFSSGYSNVKYCDTYTPFVNTPNYTSMIETSEGIHYTTEGSNFIYNKINECLNSF